MSATTGWGRAGWGAGPWGNGLAIDGVETASVLGAPMVTGAATSFLLNGNAATTALGTIIVSLTAQAVLSGVSAAFAVDDILVWGLVPSGPGGGWSAVPAGPGASWLDVAPAVPGNWTPVVT